MHLCKGMRLWGWVGRELGRRYRLLWVEEAGVSRREVRLPVWGWILLGGALCLMLWAIFAYTPLRYTMPGYPPRRFQQLYATLLERVQQLEQQVAKQVALVEELRQLQPSAAEEAVGSPLPILPTLQSGQYVLPVEGRLSRRMQPSQGHWGVDFTCGAGDPVLAIAEGVVILAEYSYQSGYVIALQHPNGLISFYKHNSRLLRQVGEQVKAGDVIAMTGGLGEYSSGPHLHLETWLGGRPIDPLKLLSYEE